MRQLMLAIWLEGKYMSIENDRVKDYPPNWLGIARPRWMVFLRGELWVPDDLIEGLATAAEWARYEESLANRGQNV